MVHFEAGFEHQHPKDKDGFKLKFLLILINLILSFGFRTYIHQILVIFIFSRQYQLDWYVTTPEVQQKFFCVLQNKVTFPQQPLFLFKTLARSA